LCDEAGDACVECLVDMDCADSNFCTDDSCASGSCQYSNNNDPCDDNLFCTLVDICSDGTCQGTGDPCGGSVCDEVNDQCELVLYWGTYGSTTLARTFLGSGSTEVLVSGTQTHDLEVVASSGMMYWTDRDAGAIYYSPVSVPDAQVLISSGSPVGLAIDRTAQRLYWNTFSTNVYAADLDGSNQTLLFSGASGRIALAPAAGKLYWIAGSEVHRCNLDASSPELVADIPGASALGNIAIDEAGQRMFLTDYNTGVVVSANLDGTGITELLTGLSNPAGLAIDRANAKLYVGDLHQILRVNLDGSGLETDIIDHADVFQVWGLAFPD
jgi:hypothetical protein